MHQSGLQECPVLSGDFYGVNGARSRERGSASSGRGDTPGAILPVEGLGLIHPSWEGGVRREAQTRTASTVVNGVNLFILPEPDVSKYQKKKRSQRLTKQTTASRNDEVLWPRLSRAWFTRYSSGLDIVGRTGGQGRPPSRGVGRPPHESRLRQLWGTPGRQGVPPGHPAWAVCRLEVHLCLGFSACRQSCLICDLGPAVV